MQCSLNPYYVNTKESNNQAIIIRSTNSPFRKNELKEKFKQNLIENKPNSSPFLKALFLDRYRKIYHRGSFIQLENCINPNGACIPGWEKLFVDSNGNFFIL